ncbi:hypothetical protein [Streptomyces profundus]|uniref:hypothetical protein n=1 Tax=Streptomyces profundus TaxID=2867410 RepID=UPI001D16991A|nr:hypothetical protein [Streptomyces sp. MA3_2.13]UED84887.1 hypothetical protein K4G22_12285 [Streptomyces sp. MA3_2.13]
MNQWEYRAVLAVDIERSSGRGNVPQQRIRDALFGALHSSVEASGVDWAACHRHDLGDGLRLTLPSGVWKPRLIHPLVPTLARRLREHNEGAEPNQRVRVRAALHAGDVRLGAEGEVTGRPLEVLSRMLDAAQLRAALVAARQELTVALMVSQHFHEETVPHGYPGIASDSFHPVTLQEKELTAPAWLHLPGAPPGPPPGAADQDGPPPAERPAGQARMINLALGNGTVNATQQGVQHIHLPRRD